MFAKTWEVGDLVWAKMKRFPYWPGKIVDPPNNSHRKSERYVYFFGSKNYGWVMNDYIVPHSETMINNCKKKGGLQAAVNEIIEAALASSQGKTKPDIPSVDEDLSIIAASIPKNKDETEKKKKTPSKRKISESTPKSSRSFKKMKISENISPTFSSTSDPSRIAIIRPFDDPPSLLSSPNAGTSAELNGASEIEYVRPTDKKIGFLGLGSIIGRCIVRNLLKSRHQVIVYDSNPSKTEDFEKAGAIVKSSPALVVEAADIIFCITDFETAKDIVLKPKSGVLQGLKGTQGTAKGFVEMSSIDEETSKGIAQAIELKGGKYLEAPITGGRKLADEGLLTILASGDESLFNDCETCFHAIARHARFLGTEIGKSMQLSIVLNTLMGSVTGVLVEALALAKRMYVSQKDLLETLKIAGFLSPFLCEKGKAVLNKNFSVDTLLKHQHDVISTALAMGEEVDQPLHVIASVNELYKHARSLGYSDLDMAAVYEGAIH